MGGGELTSEGFRHYQNLKAKKVVALEKLPMLVRFRDIKDPKTVELVDLNDLENSFGKGVKLVSATIEMTDEGIRGMEKWLPWIRDYYDNNFDGNRYEGGNAPSTLANRLSAGSFTTELSPYGH